MRNKKKGQSTLEYITVFAAIVAAIVIFSYSNLKPAVENMMNASATKINNATSNFTSW